MFQVVGHVNNGHGRYITRWPSYKLNIHLMMDSGHKSWFYFMIEKLHSLYLCLLLFCCSWFSSNNWSQSCRKDSQPSENQEPGCGRKNPSRNSKSETVQTSTYHQVVPGTKSMDIGHITSLILFTSFSMLITLLISIGLPKMGWLSFSGDFYPDWHLHGNGVCFWGRVIRLHRQTRKTDGGQS